VDNVVRAMTGPWEGAARCEPDRAVGAAADEAAEEREWLRRCREGDERAFRALLSRYRGRALYLAARMLGDGADAEDVVQEAFLRVFRSIRAFRGDARFHSWLYRIVVNLCLDRLRSRPPCPTLSLDDDQHVLSPPGTGSPDSAWETRLRVEALLARLSPELRATLLLREMGGLSYEEIARELRIPVGTVRSRLSAAREQFRRLWLLEEREDDDV
jgi:RNA polymerase sigma-70 factor (ECF subfamily)